MKDASVQPGSAHEKQLDELLQLFLQQRREGGKVDIKQFALAHPEYAEEIRYLLPALALADHWSDDSGYGFAPTNPDRIRKLGVFTLHREIGRGGMGVVFEATQEHFSQRYAIKVITNTVVPSKTLRSRFVREAESTSRLHHPHIVPAKFCGTDEGFHYMVMPLIDGVSLDRLIAQNPNNDPEIQTLFEEICLDWKQIARLGAQVASALSYAHRHGLIHRDIKPANLILDRQGNAWVTDFGLAKLFEDRNDELSRTGELIGTPRYMSPEQIFGVPDERSDVYSLGLSLYELLSARSVERKDRSSGLVARASALELPDILELNPNVPVELARVVMKACSHHPESRFRSARRLELSLNEIAYRGDEDRRGTKRESLPRESYVYQGMGLALCLLLFLMCFVIVTRRSEVAEKVSHVAPAETFPIKLERRGLTSNCITYEEPNTNLMNVVVTVFSRSDDAEQYGEGVMYLNSKDLEMTWDEADQMVGLRFAGVEVPSGALIRSAKLCFLAERTDTHDTHLRIHGLDDADPKSFTMVPYDLSNRPKLGPPIPWTPEPWVRGEVYEGPDCSDIVQKIVDRPDWAFGNAMGFVIDGKGIRNAASFDGANNQGPVLKIQYEKLP